MDTRATFKEASPEFQAALDKRRRDRMERIDALPPEIRECVHVYGLNAVKAVMDCGVTKPRQIKHIIETILDEFSPTRGSRSSQGTRAWRDA